MKLHKYFISILCIAVSMVVLHKPVFADEKQHAKAMYNIPLGATLDEVLKWCEENNAKVTNPTKQDVYRKVKNRVSQLCTYEPSLDFGNLKSFIESAFATGKVDMDEYEKMIADESYSSLAVVGLIAMDLKIIKNLSFTYKNVKRFWLPVFDDGMKLSIGICTDERITKNTRELQISIVKGDKLIPITIYFYGNNEKEFKSYAALATYSEGDSLGKLFEMIVGALNKNYGKCEYFEYSRSNVAGEPTWKIFHLIGRDVNPTALLWQRSILLITIYGGIQKKHGGIGP